MKMFFTRLNDVLRKTGFCDCGWENPRLTAKVTINVYFLGGLIVGGMLVWIICH